MIDIDELPDFEGEHGRLFLRYLIGCALEESAAVEILAGGIPVETARGSLGLAPAWLERGLALAEKRWVSACIYARTNHFGVPVRISMRADHPSGGLQADDAERLAMPLFEGGFFGNLFATDRTAYVCTPDGPPPVANILRYRVCSLPATLDANGRAVSACGFVVRGACSDPASFETPEGHYEEVIHTYLDPDAGPIAQ